VVAPGACSAPAWASTEAASLRPCSRSVRTASRSSSIRLGCIVLVVLVV